MSKYKVLEEVEVLGTVREVGSEIEVDAGTAQPFVEGGKLELVVEQLTNDETPVDPVVNDNALPDEGTPVETPAEEVEGGETPSTAPETATPEAPVAEAAPQGTAPKEGEAGWVGGHSI